MKKTCILIVGIVALAFIAFSAPAFALVDPDCDLDKPGGNGPYDNATAIRDFAVSSASDKAFRPSALSVRARACGSELKNLASTELDSLYKGMKFGLANGVEVTDTTNIQTGSYVGEGTISLLFPWPGGTGIAQAVNHDLKTFSEYKGSCPVPFYRRMLVACYLSVSDFFYFRSWVTTDGNGGLTLNVGPLDGLSNQAGFTYLEMDFCKKSGALNGYSCGSGSSPVVQKNGAPSAAPRRPAPLTPVPPCSNGNGIYSATATRADGTIVGAPSPALPGTPETSCVKWFIYPQVIGPTRKRDLPYL